MPEKKWFWTEANFAAAGVEDRVTLLPGDAHETLDALEPGFDLAFLDAEKEHYLDYLEPLVRLLRPGGLSWPTTCCRTPRTSRASARRRSHTRRSSAR